MDSAQPGKALQRAREDQKLLDRWRSGDTSAFEELFRRHQRRVYSLAYRLTGSQADAEDITAETFARAFDRLNSLRDGAKFLPWLYRVATNLCRDQGRRKSFRKTFSYDQASEDSGGDTLAEQVSDITTEPLEMAVQAETAEEVARAIAKLPDWQREAVVLFYLEDKSVEEVADTLDISPGTVKSRLSRARDALKKIIKPFVHETGELK